MINSDKLMFCLCSLGAVILEGLCVTFDRAQGIITFSESTCGPPVTLNKIHNTAGKAKSVMRKLFKLLSAFRNFLVSTLPIT